MEQLANVSVALAALNELKPDFPLALSSIKSAMLQIRLPGRFTIAPGQPQIILDVAHNPQAVSHMLVNMLKLPFAKYSYAVFGIANDKDISAIIQLTKKHFDRWFIAPINSTRKIDNEKLAKIMQDAGIDKSLIVANATINDAFVKAKSISTNNDRIVCFGSFLVVEEAYKCN
jgi:dihydrofolate synthase/folylpolyglutamate synthase